MPTVNTVSGPIDTDALGFTLVHEHIIVTSPGVRQNLPVADRAADIESSVAKVKAAQERGVKTLVDLTVADWRDIPFVKEVVARTGMQVVVATGIYWEVPHFFRSTSGRDIDYIAGLFAGDIEDGIMDTGVRAGIIKCATDEPGVTVDVERVLRASARAHRRTGVPISTHTHAASRVGLKQQDVFASEGVDLGRVIIGHSGDSDDLDYLTALMERGSYIGMDRFGLDNFQNPQTRIDIVARLCRMGYTEKMVLSHDASCCFDWATEDLVRQVVPNWRFTFIPEEVIPALRSAGVTDEQMRAMTVENPRRIFERQGAYFAVTTSRRKLGDMGERPAGQHLLANGFLIRETNFRTRDGEIDIVAERDGILVFVEVRTRRGASHGTAAESLTPAKQRRLVRLAEAYEQAREGLPEGRRIDVVALDLAADGRLLSLQHIEDAVSAD